MKLQVLNMTPKPFAEAVKTCYIGLTFGAVAKW